MGDKPVTSQPLLDIIAINTQSQASPSDSYMHVIKARLNKPHTSSDKDSTFEHCIHKNLCGNAN